MQMIKRINFVVGIVFLGVFILLQVSSVFAQSSEMDNARAYFKGKTIRFILPYNPGGGYDTYARMIAPFLEKELNLSEEQRGEFERIKAEHFERSNAVRAEIHFLKQEILEEAFSDSPDTSKVKRLARQIGEKEAEFEEFLFQHFNELKTVCKPEQLEELKKIFDEIIEKNRPPKPPPGNVRKPPPRPGP